MNWDVTLPITGYLITGVEADTEEEAIDKALKSELTIDMIENWEAHKRVCEGNIFHGDKNEAEATEGV